MLTGSVAAYDSSEWITWGNESSLPWASGCRRAPRCARAVGSRPGGAGRRLHVRDDAAWLAEMLMDLEDEVGEMVRLRLVDALRAEVG